MQEASYNPSIHQEILDTQSLDFLDKFREMFAQKMESIYAEHVNAVSSETKVLIPRMIREGKKLGDINSWAGDAFAGLLRFCPSLSDVQRDMLRDSFFEKTE